MTTERYAVLFLLVLLAVPLLYFLIAMLRSPFRPMQWVLYCIAIVICRLLWRVRYSSPLQLPLKQGAIVISNHRSSVDPLFIQAAGRRPIHWMVAREYCEHFAFSWFLRTCEVIPVNRGGIDTRATRDAIRRAQQGGLVGMFPEGRINMSDQVLLPVRPGAVLVAIKARVPIIPCFVEGSPYDRTPWSPLLMPAKVTVHFGAPIDVSQYAEGDQEDGMLGQVMLQCMAAVAELAGHADFQPQLAGRRWKPSLT